MVIIELKVPSLGTSYSFQVNEQRTAGRLLEEMLSVLKQKTGEAEDAEASGYELFSAQQGRRIRKDLALGAQGIGDGSTLVLV
jgi:hypothetical protein